MPYNRSYTTKSQTWSQGHNPQGGLWLALVASKAKAKNGVKANVNMVRCSVKTSKHRRLLQGW